MAAKHESAGSFSGKELVLSSNPDHHLWRNGRLWWVAFTVHHRGWRQERIRRSLRTDDVAEAQRRRDELLERYPQEHGCSLATRNPAPAGEVRR